MPALKLEVLNSAFKGKQIRFKEGILVGSAPECQLRAQHPDLKPRHARFLMDGDRAFVEIVDESAHIFINNQDVVRSELRHNDTVIMGPIRLRVVDDALASRASLRLDELLAEAEVADGDDGAVYDFAKEDLFFLTTRNPSLKRRIAFVIPSRDKFLDQSQVFLSRIVKHCGADEPQVDAFMTCAKELVLNAHRHGHKFDESKRITVRFRDLGDRLSLSVEDQGDGFDHRAVLASVRDKDAATAARERYLAGGFGGLGFQLITRLTESIVYNDRGNLVTILISKKAPAG